ncbi:hypothetical protein ACFWNN_32670 [Lentzea sp. NPDC058450]|uniref:hypothetical protein n=1 Tax=Lentzea sp. NPDC058450 TaxID=3346505 RepID=UPI00364EDD95
MENSFRQCTRHRKDGVRCESWAMNWSASSPDPHACWPHLTASERAAVRALSAPIPLRPRRPTYEATSHRLRKSLNKAAFLLATESGRHPGSVNTEVNGVMGVERRAEASKEQLREGLRHVGDRLRALGRPRVAGSWGAGSWGTGSGGAGSRDSGSRDSGSANAGSGSSEARGAESRDGRATFSGDPPF